MRSHRVSVLLVEDNPGDALLVEAILGNASYSAFTVSRAVSLSAALERLQEGGLHAVLLDLGLPDSQGIETFLRLHKSFPEIPVVVLTGVDDEELGMAAVRSGAQEFLVKGQAGAPLLDRALRYAIERRRAEEALRATSDELRALLQASPAPIIALDPNGCVTLWTPAAERLLGWTAKEALQQPLGIFQGADKENMDEQLLAVREGQTLADAELRARRKDGSEVDVSLSAARLCDARGEFAGILCVLVDISEHKRVEARILDAMEAERCRLGQDLHDSLGQQLTGIQLTVGAIERRLAEQLRPEAALAGSVATMLGDAMQEMRALAHGLCPMLQERGDLPRALDSFTEAIASGRGVHCSCHCDPGLALDDRSSIDVYRITQEAVNNALRHGKAKTIAVALAHSDGRVTLTIQDDGAGIPAGRRRRAGLGIHTMEYRARRMGGELSVQRGQHGGTLVTCSFLASRPATREGPQHAGADAT